MKTMSKNDSEYKTIGQTAKKLNLIDKKTGNLQTHTIRYWETQFKQIKPKIMAGGRRYYSAKDIEIINYIKYLLKDQGHTINGAKRIINKKGIKSVDDRTNLGVYKPESISSKRIKGSLRNISKIIKELKNLKNG
tara:strand:+ start:23 stop:427 length:405 start_codon:yes stop_codon:yes gene_type:complete